MARIPVVVVDDDADLRGLLAHALRRDGDFEPLEAEDGQQAMSLAIAHPDAPMLLDISLPDCNGLDLLRDLRRLNDRPIIMLTGRGSETDRVVGLELGADDYVVKPCYPREVLARVRTVLRRAAPGPIRRWPPGPTALNELLSIDVRGRQLFVHGEPVELTAKEFDLLVHLAEHAGSVVRREELLRAVWHSEPGWQSDTTVTEHVYRLRGKLGDAGRSLQTLRGVGYRFDP